MHLPLRSLLPFLLIFPLFPWLPSASAQETTSRQTDSAQIDPAEQRLQHCREQLQASQFAAALPTCEQAAQQFAASHNQAKQGRATINVGIAYAGLEQHPQAIERYRSGLSLVQAAGDREAETIAISRLVVSHAALKQYPEAIEQIQQFLALARDTQNQTQEGTALVLFARVYVEVEDYQQAIELGQQALVIWRQVGNPTAEAEVLNNLSWIYHNLGQHQESLEAAQAALAISKARGDQNGQALALNYLGIAYHSLSQYQSAIECHQQARSLFQQVDNRNGEAAALNRLGLTYQSISQYQQAIEHYQQALPLFQQAADRSNQAWVLNNLGLLQDDLGQYQQALEYYQQALSLFRQIDHRAGEASVLHNSGRAYWYLKQNQRAIEAFQQVLPIFQELGNRNSEAIVLSSLGYAYQFFKQYQPSLEVLQQALAIHREIGNRDEEALALHNLGVTYGALGQYQQAVEHFQEALSIFRAVNNREREGEQLASLGKLLIQQNQLELAIVFLKQSVNVRESIRGDIRNLSQDLQQSYTNRVAEDYRQLADLLLKENRVLEAQRILDLLKVQELEEYLRNVRGNHQTANGVEFLRPEESILQRYSQLQDTVMALNQELEQLEQRIRDGETLPSATEKRKQELINLRQELNRQFNDFAKSPEVRQLIEQLSFEAREQTLNLSQLDGLRDKLRQLNAVLLYPLILDDRLELIITTPDSPPLRRTVNIPREQLNQLIIDFRQAVQDPNTDAVTPAHKLYQQLIEPLEADLTSANTQTIIYAPDGALRYVPLAALHDGNQWLAQRFRVNNITAASLQELVTQPPVQPRVLAGAFADPRLSYPISIGQRTTTFSGLPYTADEVDALKSNMPQTTAFLNQAFNKAAIESNLSGYNILHFATHAAVVPGDASESFILFGDSSRLTLRQVEELSLADIDLVVLSACETGLGGFDNNGEQILGLGYQFQNRGARAVIASLWQVSDGGTQILMAAFYTALKTGMTKAEALRQAQIALITGDFSAVGRSRGTIMVVNTETGLPPQISNNLNHPYYWSPFILIGNGL